MKRGQESLRLDIVHPETECRESLSVKVDLRAQNSEVTTGMWATISEKTGREGRDSRPVFQLLQ